MTGDPLPEIQPVRLKMRVRGLVQGVGFRAYVAGSATQMGATGWVRNVGEDEVHLIAEGPRTVLDRLVDAVRRGPRASRVDDSGLEWLSATGEFHEFRIAGSI